MEEELKQIKAIGDQIDGFKNKLGEKADKAEVSKLEQSLATLKENVEKGVTGKVGEAVSDIKNQLDTLKTLSDEMNSSINVIKDSGNRPGAQKSFGHQLVDAMKAAGFFDKKLQKGEHRTVEVDKLAGTMTTANVTAVGTNAIPFSLSDAEAGLTRIVRRQPWILEIANVSSTNKMYVQWAEQANADGAADETAEGNDKNQIDFDWVEKSKKVEKITAFIKVSKEALDDLDGLANEINTELRETILLQTDADLLSGDGITPTIAGLLTMDTAYDAGAFAGTIVDPNFADVLRTAIAQVVANQFRPNYILLHPTDVAKMDLEKSEADGHYTLPPFKSADGMVVSGVRVLENTGQTVDKFTVGDFTKFNVKLREGLTIDMGLDGSDFTKNLVTILGEIRLASYIKTNHAGAFVSGDFSDAIAALATS